MQEVTHRDLADITKRQREVVELIAAGCSNEEVGDRLGISPRTAKAHAMCFGKSSASPGVGRSRPLTGCSREMTRSTEASGRSPPARGTDGTVPAAAAQALIPTSDGRDSPVAGLACACGMVNRR